MKDNLVIPNDPITDHQTPTLLHSTEPLHRYPDITSPDANYYIDVIKNLTVNYRQELSFYIPISDDLIPYHVRLVQDLNTQISLINEKLTKLSHNVIGMDSLILKYSNIQELVNLCEASLRAYTLEIQDLVNELHVIKKLCVDLTSQDVVNYLQIIETSNYIVTAVPSVPHYFVTTAAAMTAIVIMVSGAYFGFATNVISHIEPSVYYANLIILCITTANKNLKLKAFFTSVVKRSVKSFKTMGF